MNSSDKILAGVGMTILAIAVGLAGFGVFFVAGEGTNNSIIAFAAVSILFFIFAGLFSLVTPQAWWAIGFFMAVPVVWICLQGARMGWFYLPGAIWILLVSELGAYLGRRLKLARTQRREKQQTDPD